MNIRDFYVDRIRKILRLGSSIDFSVKFFYELGRAESNVSIKVADFNQNCLGKLQASVEFLDLYFSNNGMLTWKVPDIIWYDPLIILDDKLNFFEIPRGSLILNEDDLFDDEIDKMIEEHARKMTNAFNKRLFKQLKIYEKAQGHRFD